MSDDKLVYSTHPEIFMKKKQAEEPSNSGNAMPPLGQVIKVRREKNGRAGKTVTVLFDFQTSQAQMEALTKKLRKDLGTGGTIKDGKIELQGDQLQKALDKLAQMGYKPKQAGG